MMLFGGHVIDEGDLRRSLQHEDDRVRQLARLLTDSPDEADLLTDEEVEEEPSALDRDMSDLQLDEDE